MFVVAGSTIPTSIVEVATTLVEWPVVSKIAAKSTASMAIARSVVVASIAVATVAVVVAELATEATAAMTEAGSKV